MSFLSILDTLLLGPLKLLFEIIYVYANRIIGHPGLAIICLSLVMNILVLPLYKRADAMQEASRDVENKLRDGVRHIKKTFSGDERMMMLQTYYRQNNYKPTQALNGSVSLLLEVPFFMAAYQFLSNLKILEGVSLGPIGDLSAPDGLLVIGGLAINVLPVLMTLVNVISSAIYLKGFPLKTKIQLYGMALFFLVFLYTSPSGLVFYWTLNNVFSLVKTVFYKLKNPKKILAVLVGTVAIGIMAAGLMLFRGYLMKKLVVAGIGALLLLAVILYLRKPAFLVKACEIKAKPKRSLFFLGTLVLTILTGLFIPSTVIAASPQEFADVSNFYHPLWYAVSALCLSAGTFMIWFGVFYWLATPKVKTLMERLIWVLCGVMVVNYLFFGTDMGVISSTLQYERMFDFATSEKLINLAIIALIAAILYVLACKTKRVVGIMLLTASIALGVISTVNVVTIKKSIDQLDFSGQTEPDDTSLFTLSTTGKNVVVIVLDRAMGEYVPYLIKEKPELMEQFDGFTYYNNTLSFGGFTNFAMPATLGGYEYTPVEMNKRASELLKDKHNEALKVMPVTFLENGFDVTVCDPSYANYQWIPDLSVFNDYPSIKTYLTEGKVRDAFATDQPVANNSRNFFVFSCMKSMPLIVQPTIYNAGLYLQIDSIMQQVSTGTSVADGLNYEFNKRYQVLCHLSDLTAISSEESSTFMYMVNDATHYPAMLQAPDYEVAEHVDNTQYDAQHQDRFTVDNKTLIVNDYTQIGHYHANMGALLQLGKWFDYLRENGVYDNTRIIVVSDHGRNTGQLENMILDMGDGTERDTEYYFPLLLVKDFNSTGFSTSDAFMTNADVPMLAMTDLIEAPVNPFTGKAIDDAEKYAHDQFIILSGECDTMINNGNTFLPSRWASISDNLHDPEQWTFLTEEIVLDEHQFP